MKLSKEKREKVAEQVLAFLYQSFPHAKFTSEVAKEIARDEEFIKNLMFELKDKNVVLAVKKNETGKDFIRRIRWQLSGPAYQAYDNKAKMELSQSTVTAQNPSVLESPENPEKRELI